MTIDHALRPLRLADYQGQPQLSAHLGVLLAAARSRGEKTLPHVLLHGPGGLGKTTLAYIIAGELGSRAHVAMGPALEDKADIFALLQRIAPGDLLFIDEVHRLKPHVCEILYTVLEDGKVYFPVATTNGEVQVEIVMPPFTFVGATTEPDLLAGPMRMRFGATLTLQFYLPTDLAVILAKNASKLGVACEPEALRLIASRARGTPRVANHLLRFARDLASIEHTPITVAVAEKSLDTQGIDALGLSEQDRTYLRTLIEVYGGGPAGAQALAATMGCSPGTIASVIEPYLLMTGLVVRTQRGRKSTDKAVKHLARYDAAVAPKELFAA